ncbi:MAG: SH3 domain-containing protein [Chloroflexota bacterium]
MNRKFLFLLFFIFLLAGSFLLKEENQVLVEAMPLNFTVPTRTPTSPPPQPTSGGGGGGGGGNNDPAPTQPPAATETPTSIPTPIVLAPTPPGGYLPTAEACSTNPTLTAQTLTNVRSGPGTDYEIIGELVFFEVRPIVGRAEEINWWQISLNGGGTGWVSNSVVQYHGNISVIPVVEAPLINGVAPTPGIPWTPVLPTGCQPLPAWTPVPAEAAVIEPTEETSGEVTESSAEEATAVPNTPPPEPTATANAVEEPATPTTEAIEPVPLMTDQDSGVQVAVNQPIETAVPLQQPTNNAPSSNSIFLIFGSIILVFVFGIALLRTYQSNKA